MTKVLSVTKNTYIGMIAMVAILMFAYLAFADGTGSLLPTSDGAYTQWTPSTGSTHYTLVDESSCNGTSDYNSTNTVGNRDTYGVSIASVPNGATVTEVAITPCASNDKNGQGSTLNVFYRWNGANSADAGNYTLSGTTPTQLSTATFSGLSFVKGSGSILEVGAVLSAGAKGARLSRLATVVTYTPLYAPSNFNAIGAATSTESSTVGYAALFWSDNSSNENGFEIERSDSQSGPYSLVHTTGANTTSYNDFSTASDQTYYYRARAVNSGGNSGYSNVDYAITATVVPNDPSNLVATVGTSTSAILTWSDNSTNEEGFTIERSTDGVNFSPIATKGLNVTTHTDSGLATSTTYYYRVKAFNNIGSSGYTNTASVFIP